jgi:hypothetical protein
MDLFGAPTLIATQKPSALELVLKQPFDVQLHHQHE